MKPCLVIGIISGPNGLIVLSRKIKTIAKQNRKELERFLTQQVSIPIDRILIVDNDTENVPYVQSDWFT